MSAYRIVIIYDCAIRCSNRSQAIIQTLSRVALPFGFKKDDYIYREGDDGDTWLFLGRGDARVFKNSALETQEDDSTEAQSTEAADDDVPMCVCLLGRVMLVERGQIRRCLFLQCLELTLCIPRIFLRPRSMRRASSGSIFSSVAAIPSTPTKYGRWQDIMERICLLKKVQGKASHRLVLMGLRVAGVPSFAAMPWAPSCLLASSGAAQL